MTAASPNSHIFISYARKDSKVADDLQTRLRQRGIEVWVDRSRLVPGAAWPEGLRRAVEGCDAMLVLLSPASLASEFVRREYLHALSLGKVIIPVVIGKVEAFPEELRDVQWIDLTQQSGQGYYDLLLALDAHGLMLSSTGLFDWELALARATRHQLPQGSSAYWVNDPRWYTRGLVTMCFVTGLLCAGWILGLPVVGAILREQMAPGPVTIAVEALFAALGLVLVFRGARSILAWSRYRAGHGLSEVIVATPDGFILRELSSRSPAKVRVLAYRGTSHMICRPTFSSRVTSITLRYTGSLVRQRAIIPARFLDTAAITRQLRSDFDQHLAAMRSSTEEPLPETTWR